jgi:hypothetical protein
MTGDPSRSVLSVKGPSDELTYLNAAIFEAGQGSPKAAVRLPNRRLMRWANFDSGQ